MLERGRINGLYVCRFLRLDQHFHSVRCQYNRRFGFTPHNCSYPCIPRKYHVYAEFAPENESTIAVDGVNAGNSARLKHGSQRAVIPKKIGYRNRVNRSLKLDNYDVISLIRKIYSLVDKSRSRFSSSPQDEFRRFFEVHEEVIHTISKLNEYNSFVAYRPDGIASQYVHVSHQFQDTPMADTLDAGNVSTTICSLKADAKKDQEYYADLIKTIYLVYPIMNTAFYSVASTEYVKREISTAHGSNNGIWKYINEINMLVFANHTVADLDGLSQIILTSDSFDQEYSCNEPISVHNIIYNRFISEAPLFKQYSLLLQIAAVNSQFQSNIIESYHYLQYLIKQLVNDINMSVDLAFNHLESSIVNSSNGSPANSTGQNANLEYKIASLWSIVRNGRLSNKDGLLADTALIILQYLSNGVGSRGLGTTFNVCRSKHDADCMHTRDHPQGVCWNVSAQEDLSQTANKFSVFPPILIQLISYLESKHFYDCRIGKLLARFVTSLIQFNSTTSSLTVSLVRIPQSSSRGSSSPSATDGNCNYPPFLYLGDFAPCKIGVDPTTLLILKYLENAVEGILEPFLMHNICYSFSFYVYHNLHASYVHTNSSGDSIQGCSTNNKKHSFADMCDYGLDIQSMSKMAKYIYDLCPVVSLQDMRSLMTENNDADALTPKRDKVDTSAAVSDTSKDRICLAYANFPIAVELLYRNYLLPNLPSFSYVDVIFLPTLRTVLRPMLYTYMTLIGKCQAWIQTNSGCFNRENVTNGMESRGDGFKENILNIIHNNDNVVRLLDAYYTQLDKVDVLNYVLLLSNVSVHFYTNYQIITLPSNLHAYYHDISHSQSTICPYTYPSSFGHLPSSSALIRLKTGSSNVHFNFRNLLHNRHICKRISDAVQTLNAANIRFYFEQPPTSSSRLFSSLETFHTFDNSVLVIPSLLRTLASCTIYRDSIPLLAEKITAAIQHTLEAYANKTFKSIQQRYCCDGNYADIMTHSCGTPNQMMNIPELDTVDSISHLCEHLAFLNPYGNTNNYGTNIYDKLFHRALYLIYSLSPYNTVLRIPEKAEDINFVTCGDIIQLLESYILGVPSKPVSIGFHHYMSQYAGSGDAPGQQLSTKTSIRRSVIMGNHDNCFTSNVYLHDDSDATSMDKQKGNNSVVIERYLDFVRIMWSVATTTSPCPDNSILDDAVKFLIHYDNKCACNLNKNEHLSENNNRNLVNIIRHWESSKQVYDPDFYAARKTLKQNRLRDSTKMQSSKSHSRQNKHPTAMMSECGNINFDLHRNQSIIGSGFVYSGSIVRPTEMIRQLILTYHLSYLCKHISSDTVQYVADRLDLERRIPYTQEKFKLPGTNNGCSLPSSNSLYKKLLLLEYIDVYIIENKDILRIPLTIASNSYKFKCVCANVQYLIESQFRVNRLASRLKLVSTNDIQDDGRSHLGDRPGKKGSQTEMEETLLVPLMNITQKRSAHDIGNAEGSVDERNCGANKENNVGTLSDKEDSISIGSAKEYNVGTARDKECSVNTVSDKQYNAHTGSRNVVGDSRSEYDKNMLYVSLVIDENEHIIKTALCFNPIVYPHMAVLKRTISRRLDGCNNTISNRQDETNLISDIVTDKWRIDSLVHLVPKHKSVMDVIRTNNTSMPENRNDYERCADENDITNRNNWNNAKRMQQWTTQGINGMEFGNNKLCMYWNQIASHIVHVDKLIKEDRENSNVNGHLPNPENGQKKKLHHDNRQIKKIRSFYCSNKITAEDRNNIFHCIFSQQT